MLQKYKQRAILLEPEFNVHLTRKETPWGYIFMSFLETRLLNIFFLLLKLLLFVVTLKK